MQTLSALVLTCMFVVLGAMAYRSFAWSLDSPVFRRAVRRARFGWPTWLGWAIGLCAALWLTWFVCQGELRPSTYVCGAVFAIASWVTVLMAGCVLDDLRDTFLLFAGKLRGHMPIEGWVEDDLEVFEAIDDACREKRHCDDDLRPCRAGAISHSWRTANRRRTGQRH